MEDKRSGGAQDDQDQTFPGSQFLEFFMGAVVIANIIVMILDTDAQSLCAGDRSCEEGPLTTRILNNMFLAIYTIELCGRVAIQRWDVFKNYFNWLDAFIVLVGLIDLIGSELPSLQMLRLFRLTRITRITKLLRYFPMLQQLLRRLKSAAMATFWGYILIMTVLMIWSLIAVEIIQPVNRTLSHDEGDWCEVAFESVVRSSLYFFVTLIAGDAWGECAIPILRAAPYTYFVFVGAHISVQLGLMNLLLAVIVDASSDEEQVLKDKAEKCVTFTSKLHDALEKADADNNGSISWEEMIEGYRNDPSVEKTFQLLDIGERDLQEFFDLAGEGEGSEKTVSFRTFVEQFQKAQIQDPRIYAMMMKLQMQKMMKMLQTMTPQPGVEAPGACSSIEPKGGGGIHGPAGHHLTRDGRRQLDQDVHAGVELDSIWRRLESQIESQLRAMSREIVDYAAGASRSYHGQCQEAFETALPTHVQLCSAQTIPELGHGVPNKVEQKPCVVLATKNFGVQPRSSRRPN